MCLDSVLGNEEAVGNFLVAEAGSHELEDFELAGADVVLVELFFVEGKMGSGGLGDEYFFFYNDGFGFWFGELACEPDTECCEYERYGTDVEIHGVVDDEKTPLEPLHKK